MSCKTEYADCECDPELTILKLKDQGHEIESETGRSIYLVDIECCDVS